MVSNNRYLKPIIIALCFIAAFCTLACCGVQPLRPWFSETPRERHIEDGDRLMASYFNEQLNVIYNWAQRINTEIDNLMHNGVGIASLTADIINCTGKIINPEIDNLLRNGIGVASITADEATIKRLSVTEKTSTAALAMPARNQPPELDGHPQIYYDSSLDRFRIFQEGGWRDLSPNVFIASDSLASPLVLQGYLQATNIYASNSVTVKDNISIGKELYVGENMNVNGLATFTKGLNIGPNYGFGGPAVLNAIHGVTRLGVLSVDSHSSFNALSSFNSSARFFSNASVDGDFLVEGNAQFNKTLRIPRIQDHSWGEGSIYYDTTDKKIKFFNGTSWESSSGDEITVDSAMSSTSTNPVQNKAVKNYVESNTVTSIAQGASNGTIAVTKNGSTFNVAVKGLGTAAYANVASITAQLSATAPTGPHLGQTYFDTTVSLLKYWNGTRWVEIKELSPQNLFVSHSQTYTAQQTGHWTQTSILNVWVPNAQGLVYFQCYGYAETGAGHVTGHLRVPLLLDTSLPWSVVATPYMKDNGFDPTVCLAVSSPTVAGAGTDESTTFSWSCGDNDGGAWREGKIYFHIQGFKIVR